MDIVVLGRTIVETMVVYMGTVSTIRQLAFDALRWLRAENWRALEILLLAGAVIFSARQTSVASQAINETRRLAAAQALYDMRRQAMATFIQGDLNFETAFYQIRNRLPVDVEEITEVNKMNMSQLSQLREVVEPIVAARNDNTVSFRSTIAAWPLPLRKSLVNSGAVGNALANCYESAALRALNETELGEIRQSLNTKCRDLGGKHGAYRRQNDAIYAQMANEVYNAAASLGANPERQIPDSVRSNPDSRH